MAGARIFEISSSKGNVITTVYGWNRSTVADGEVLTDITIKPICDALNIGMGEVKDFTDELNAISSQIDSFYDEYYTQEQTRDLIADEIESISSVVANNYLSANRDAISAGKNIEVIELNGSVIGIKTSDDVEFTTLNGQNVNNTIGSAESGKLAYDYLTNSASFYAGPGISFYSAGQNLLGISAEGQAFVDGRCIAIGHDNSINLSSDIDVDNITATQKLYISGNNDGKYSTASFTYSSVDMIKYGQPSPELHFNAAELSATGAIGDLPVTKSIKWYDVANMNDKFMFVEPNAVGSTLEANTAIKIVVTSSLPAPNLMEDNTYYIV
jgi:hypothetical protein